MAVLEGGGSVPFNKNRQKADRKNGLLSKSRADVNFGNAGLVVIFSGTNRAVSAVSKKNGEIPDDEKRLDALVNRFNELYKKRQTTPKWI
jgi:hypothetical protein